MNRLVVLALLSVALPCVARKQIEIHLGKEIGPLPPIWASTHFDPAFLSPARPGRYSVRALDYWGRKGKASEAVQNSGVNRSQPGE